MSIRVCTNTNPVDWQRHSYKLFCEDSSDAEVVTRANDLAAVLREGDRIVVWARAQVCVVHAIGQHGEKVNDSRAVRGLAKLCQGSSYTAFYCRKFAAGMHSILPLLIVV